MGDMSKVGDDDFVKTLAEKVRAAGDDPIGKRRRQLEAEKERRIRRGPRPAIPRRFQDRRLGDYKPRNKSQAAALSAVTSWVRGAAADEGPMLALIGPKGVGKSHLLYGAAWMGALRDEAHHQLRQTLVRARRPASLRRR